MYIYTMINARIKLFNLDALTKLVRIINLTLSNSNLATILCTMPNI